MWELKNPIPESFSDTKEILDFFKTLNKDKRVIIPYYGKTNATSHSFLRTINRLCEKSPSYRASENQIVNMAFGGNPTVIALPIPGLEDEETTEPTYEQKKEFLNWLSDLGMSVVKIRKVTEIMCKHRTRSGNCWIKLTLAKEGDQYSLKIQNLHFYLCGYLGTEPGEQKYVAVTPYWDLKKLNDSKQKITIYPVSFEGESLVWKEKVKDEVWETVIHCGDFGEDENTWYGRSRINSIIDNMGSECARIDHKVKVNNTSLTSTNLLFFEEEPQVSKARLNAGKKDGEEEPDNFQKTVTTLRATVSAEGSHKEVRSLGAMEYPNGTKPPTNVKLEVRRDYQWDKTCSDDDEKQIYSVVGASREISGNQQTKSGIGSEALINRYIVLNERTIDPEQSKYESFWNWVIMEIAAKVENQSFDSLGIKFPDRIEKIIQKLRETMDAKDKATTATEEETEED